MARNESFLELQTMLREELGRSPDVSVGVDDLPILKRAINKAYATIYDEHDWPHLRRVFPKVQMAAGSRYYDLPDDLNIERVEQVNVWWNGLPQPVQRGIAFEEYATFDPDDNERSDPVLAWDVRDDDGTPVIEVWPLPASNSPSLQFIGLRSAPKLVNDEDLCLLDDELVVLLAAAQHARRQNSRDADDILAQFRARMSTMKARVSGGAARRYRVGVGEPVEQDYPRHKAVVRVS